MKKKLIIISTYKIYHLLTKGGLTLAEYKPILLGYFARGSCPAKATFSNIFL